MQKYCTIHIDNNIKFIMPIKNKTHLLQAEKPF